MNWNFNPTRPLKVYCFERKPHHGGLYTMPVAQPRSLEDAVIALLPNFPSAFFHLVYNEFPDVLLPS